MALGGTKAKIPRPILNLVANTPVLGVSRRGIDVSTANMLQTAQALCRLVGEIGLPGWFDWQELKSLDAQWDLHGKVGLIRSNGDAELWTRLCTLNNPAPIHVMQVEGNGKESPYRLYSRPSQTYSSQTYSGAVGNRRGQVEAALDPFNDTPWCVVDPTLTEPNAEQLAAKQAWLSSQRALPAPGATAGPLPLCPKDFVSEANRFKGGILGDNSQYVYGNIDDWSARGAINAGQAVFIYLDQMISQGKGRDLNYDECDKLGN